MSSAVSLGAFSVHVWRYQVVTTFAITGSTLCKNSWGEIRDMAWQFKRLHSGAVRIFSSWMLTFERKTDDSGQNNDKCEYFKCLFTWQTKHSDHKLMYYISRTQHQFFLPIYSWPHVSALIALHHQDWWSLVDQST